MGSCFWVSCCRSGKDVFSLLVAVDGQGRMPLTLFACGCAVYATSAAIKQLGGALALPAPEIWVSVGIGFISVFPQHLLDVGAWSAFELSAQGEFAALVSVGSAQPHHNVWDKETSSSPSFRLVEIMCLPQCLLAGERWRECSRSCLLIRSSSGLCLSCETNEPLSRQASRPLPLPGCVVSTVSRIQKRRIWALPLGNYSL